jgi:ketosteroid isomerase-like protein
MSRENVEVVRHWFESANRRDWDAALRTLDQDVELTTPPGINEGPYRGREEWLGYFQELLSPFEAWAVEPEEFFEKGDQVVVFVKTRARPKGSDAEIEIRNGSLWTLRDCRVLSMRFYPKPEEALKAAGLSEQDAHADS